MCLLVPHLPLPNSVAFLGREEVLAIADDAPPVALIFICFYFFFLLKKKSKRSPFDELTFFLFLLPPPLHDKPPPIGSLSLSLSGLVLILIIERDESEGESHVFQKKKKFSEPFIRFASRGVSFSHQSVTVVSPFLTRALSRITHTHTCGCSRGNHHSNNNERRSRRD